MAEDIYTTYDKHLYKNGQPVSSAEIASLMTANLGDGYSGGNKELIQGAFQSGNFITAVRGWQLSSDSAEFQTGVFNIGGTTITIDNTQDIQTNLNLISTSGGGTLFLQPGTYTLTADVSIPTGVHLEGVSRDSVIIDCNTSYKVNIIGSGAYTGGSVAINDGDTTVVGTGTTFTSTMVGQYILLSGIWYEITVFTDTTHITISPTYAGANLTGYGTVIATVNFASSIAKLTITNATGVGLKCQYAQEYWINDVIIYTCGTGIDVDDSVFPRFLMSAVECGVNMDMNNCWGWKIDFSEFSDSTTGAGVVMSNSGVATFFDSLMKGNTGNGVSLTSCRDIAFVSVGADDNGGKGFELISGNSDIQFVGLVNDGNASDGIKFTATTDRCTVVAVSVTNNGGYGINIAAATCDDNIINAPAYSGNSSGTLNDSGTGTITIPGATTPIMRVYTSDGTWTKPANLKYIIVEVVGGGGGGGGTTNNNTTGGGGGGGGYSREVLAASVLASTEDYDVGAAGGGGATGDGTAGGTSNFGTTPFLQATGGGLGTGNINNGQGGAGGVGSNGTLNIEGQDGGAGLGVATGNYSVSGYGGDSHYGGGGGSVSSQTGTAGLAGNNYGGGGSGAAAGTSSSDIAGGDGKAGVVIVTEYY